MIVNIARGNSKQEISNHEKVYVYFLMIRFSIIKRILNICNIC